MNTEEILQQSVIDAVTALYGTAPNANMVQIQKTKKEFEGDFTVVVFPFVKMAKLAPEIVAEQIGNKVKENCQLVEKFNVVKGFLNFCLQKSVATSNLLSIDEVENYGFKVITDKSKKIVLEFSSPNTNKPLHLGHLRNNFLGDSISRILKAGGNNVIKVNLVNDRGIHICKSMLAWKLFGNGQTPENSGIKGDHLVGDYYVLFDKKFKEEVKSLLPENFDSLTDEQKEKVKKECEEKSSLMIQARQMLQKWEAKDPEIYALWQQMNSWVYDGFDKTYDLMGISFDKVYHESETYLSGKKFVLKALEDGICSQADDKSVFIDLTNDGLDKKILLRKDGTSVYMTQDLGTAALRYDDYHFDEHIYVVGNEQDYHFKVLKLVLQKIGFAWGEFIKHFSYGMVELPNGKMKSREGTVVDADDLIEEMKQTALATSQELGKFKEMTSEEQDQAVSAIAMAALKYFILKVDPKKNMMFDPNESIDFNGNTGPFVLYTYARIQSIFRKLEDKVASKEIAREKLSADYQGFTDVESDLVQTLVDFSKVIDEACKLCSPARIANYVYELCKKYNQFYHDFKILSETDVMAREFRLMLSNNVAKVIKNAMQLLGIQVINKM